MYGDVSVLSVAQGNEIAVSCMHMETFVLFPRVPVGSCSI